MGGVETLAARASAATPAEPTPSQASTDKIFQALEQALPWSEGRKLRHEQRAAVKVPVPTPTATSKAEGRMSRMIKPYGRPDKNGERKGLFSSLSEMKKKGEQARAEKDKGKGKERDVGQTTNGTAGKINGDVSGEQQDGDSSVLDISAENDRMSTDQIELVPTLSKPSLVGFATSPSPSSSGPKPSAAPASRYPSSLRVGRTKTANSHAHTSSAALGGRSNRFGVTDEEDEEDADGEDDGLPGADELKAWAQKTAIPMTIPTGWSFGGDGSKESAKVLIVYFVVAF